ncbi:hypothetical protein [Orrella marina]|uniref:Uncharacterized protein n=1 Tax=Orrella marina TaxID=2163011 RepID=A0A2R4XH03_9BURK|nr:hypothetical protein [Orrella marina]AWB33092.1 hypothetical protein DBV39_04465 [Orrella marina]
MIEFGGEADQARWLIDIYPALDILPMMFQYGLTVSEWPAHTRRGINLPNIWRGFITRTSGIALNMLAPLATVPALAVQT